VSSSISAPTGAATRGPTALALLDHLSDIVVVVDTRGTLCYANAACAELLGRSTAHLLGTNALELVHPDDREMALDALTETVAKGPGIRDPLTVRVGVTDDPGREDAMRLLELVANNLLDTPNVCGIVICARDVTGRAQPSTRHDALPTDADFSFDRAPSACAVVGPNGRFTRVNPAMVTLTGHTAADLIGMQASNLAHPDELEDERTVSARLASGDLETDTRERRLRRADGEWAWVRRTYWMLRNSDGSVRCINLALVDVTEQRATQEHALQLRDILETSRELVFLTDTAGRIQYINPRARLLLGLNEGDQPQDRLEGFLGEETMARIPDQILPVLLGDSVWTGELTMLAVNGEEIPVACTVQLHRDAQGDITLVSAIAHDIRELKRAQRLLEHQATHDVLTMLPNRQLFQEMGEQALARADRDGTTVAVLFLDLDRFKHVNDTFGHPVGDELLVEVAARLRDSVRKGDALARFGGDEFAICCEHPAGQREMLELAQRLIAALSRPAQLGAAVAEVGVSIGIAIGAGSRVTIDTLLRDADVALYQAKEQGRGRAVIFGTTAPADIGPA
jgi:diguanylate cyclase (GGDEF)-like protein/PAS domain S-box-containing protein